MGRTENFDGHKVTYWARLCLSDKVEVVENQKNKYLPRRNCKEIGETNFILKSGYSNSLAKFTIWLFFSNRLGTNALKNTSIQDMLSVNFPVRNAEL